MRIHSDILNHEALQRLLRTAPTVPADVHFVVYSEHASRQRRIGFEIQLGTYDKWTGNERTKRSAIKARHYKNSGTDGASSVFAASYDEWGWFLACLFAVDENAIAGPYNGLWDFNAKTHDKYVLFAVVN